VFTVDQLVANKVGFSKRIEGVERGNGCFHGQLMVVQAAIFP
jgi:hypothetical protein